MYISETFPKFSVISMFHFIDLMMTYKLFLEAMCSVLLRIQANFSYHPYSECDNVIFYNE